MLIGGQAVLVHGEPRVTEDIDITLAAEPDRLGDVVQMCDRIGLAPLPENVAQFVAETFVLPARHALTGFRVDFVFSSTQFEREAIARAVPLDIAGEPVAFATPEDLLIHKLFAARPRDLEDARGIVRRRGATLDWGYIERWAAEFAAVPGQEGMPALVKALRA